MAHQLAVARGRQPQGACTRWLHHARHGSLRLRATQYTTKKQKTIDKTVSRSWRSEARSEVRALARTRGDTTIGEPSEPSTQLSPQPSFKVSKTRKQGWRISLLWRGEATSGACTRWLHHARHGSHRLRATQHTTKKNKNDRQKCQSFLGGLKRIRTAVAAFAELCLATRPSDHITLSGVQIYKLFLFSQNFCHFSTEKSKFSTKTASEEPNSAKKS